MKKKALNCLLILLAAALCLSGCGAAGNQDWEDYAPRGQESNPLYYAGDAVSFDIRPQDDFYGYVNAETLWNTSVPFDGFTAGTFDSVNGRVKWTNSLP